MDGALHPGADDNASGTAVVLELARAFVAAGPLDRTLVFEQGALQEEGTATGAADEAEPEAAQASA